MLPNVEYIKTLVNGLKEFVNSKIKLVRKDIDSLPQADWNQNDPTTKDYVKNRTHWIENGFRQEDYLIGLNTDGVSSVENKNYKNGVIPLVVGEQVQVSFVAWYNGSISSQCTAIVAKDAAGEPCIDQPIGLPITIYADHATYRRDWVTNSGSGHVIVTRTVALKHVHPMDEEYLANGQEKICWTESGLTELYANKNAEFKLSGVYFYIVTLPSIDSFGLVAGKKYRVVWDEVPYDCTCVSASGYGRNFSWIGSPTLAAPYNEFGSGNSFPFCISTKRNGTKIEGNGVAASRPGKHSFILYEIGDDIVHKIPDKYIPSDFVIKATIGSGNAITLDKTFEQIQEAINDGKKVLVDMALGSNHALLPLISSTPDRVLFAAIGPGSQFPTAISVIVHSNRVYFDSIEMLSVDPNGIIPQVSIAAPPTEDTHIATKKYVDDKVSDKELILSSSTAGSTKKFKITVDDTGALSAVEVTT